MPLEPSRRRYRLPEILLGAYLLALVYGSLYPWTGWRAIGLPRFDFLFEPWPRYWTWFDLLVNVLVYLPPGALLAAVLARRLRPAPAMFGALVLASCVSLALEALQSLLPGRVPARTDWLANSVGALLGAWLSSKLARSTGWRRQGWHRESLPAAEAGAGLALLVAWVAIQMHPQRLLFGTGDVVEQLLGLAAAVVAELSDADLPAIGAPAGAPDFHAVVRAQAEHGVQIEAFGTASAVVAIGLIVREIWPAGGPRLLATAGLLSAAMAVRSISGAVLLGPGQAFAWLSAGAQGGLVTGAVALAVLSAGRRIARLRVTLAALLLTSLLTSVFPPDAYHDSTLRVWNQGAWRNFNGLLQGLAMLWPFAAIAWCAARLRTLKRSGAPDL